MLTKPMHAYPFIKTHAFFLHVFLWLLFSGATGYSQLNTNFTVDKTGGCSPLTVSFTNKTTGASANAVYTWDFGNGNTAAVPNPGAIFINEQTYTVTLTVQDGNQTSVKTQAITVYQKPAITDFSVSVNKGCLPVPVTFSSSTSAGSGTIASYYWDFGDGSVQQAYNASLIHNYTLPQKATVSLTVTNTYGCYSTLQKKNIVEILPSLTAGFTTDKRVLCKVTDAVQFSNTSRGPGTLSYTWDFGDGNTSANLNPSHAFNKKGIYTVKLTTISSEGCTTSNTQTNVLNVASYSTAFDVPPLICTRSNATFYARNTPAPDYSVWQINGSWETNYNNSLNTTFYTAGPQTIKLFNRFGACEDSATHIVSVKETPDLKGFEMGTYDKCGAPETVQFKDTTPNAAKWEWDFNYQYPTQNVHATTQAPAYTYTIDGFYQVQLKVTNTDGCSATTSKYFQTIKPYVTLSVNTSGFPNNNGCGTLTGQFKAYSSEPIVAYNWNFGDGNTSSAAEPVYTYTTPGNFQVSLNYTTVNGCTNTVYYNSITVYQKPEVDFTASQTQVCGNNTVIFSGTVTPAQGYNNLIWYWDLGGGNAGYYGERTSTSYNSAGTYPVKLIVYNGTCSDTMIKTNYITVLPPFVGFTGMTNTCSGTRGDVTISQQSTDATSLIWNFGDGSAPITTAPSQTTSAHTYTRSGSYTVTLTAVNGACRVNTSMISNVLLKQNPLLTANKTVVCKDGPMTIKISNYDRNPKVSNGFPNYSMKFQYGDESQFTGAVSANTWPWNNVFDGTLQYFERGKQNIRVITTSIDFGCADTSNFVPLQIAGAVPGFEVVTDKVCYKNAVVLRDTSVSFGSAIRSWQWDFSDGQTSTQSGTVSHVYNNPGSYYVSLKITDASGCSSTSSAYTVVNTYGPKAAFSASATNVPLKSTVSFYNNTNVYGSYNTTWQWFVNDVPFSTANSSSYYFDKPGTYTVKLISTNPTTQCSSEQTLKIVVNNFNPAFNFSYTRITASSCPPVLVRFNNTSINYSRVTWDFGDGITLDNVNYPSHIYEKPGKYIVTLYVYGAGGLTGTYIDSVFIKQPQAGMQTSLTEACIGNTITLNATNKNAGSYLWDPGDGSMVQTADSFVTHQYRKPGLYIPVLLMQETSGGCAAATSLGNKINIHSNPVVSITPAAPVVCLGNSQILQASGGIGYEWSPVTGLSDALVANPVAAPVTTTTYAVKVSDNLGCTNTGTVKVTVIHPVTVSINSDTSVCGGNPIRLHATGADLYTWINNTTGLNNVNIGNPIAKPFETTTYTVAGSDAYRCFSDTASVTIRVLPVPSVEAGPDVEVWAGNPAQLHATGSHDVTAWNWTPAYYLSCIRCADPVSKALVQTTYTVTVRNQYGCKASDSVVVKLLCEEGRVAIPNGFSPNGDGVNDVFIIKGISMVKHLILFNRWGQKVFERSNYIAGDRSLCWDGTINGRPAADGTYVYFAELECPAGGSFVRKGTVMLLR